MVSEILQNEMDPQFQLFYDYDKNFDETAYLRKQVYPRDRRRIFHSVRTDLQSILTKFGAEYFSTPTFSAKGNLDDICDKYLMMDYKGAIVYPAFDLRVNFSRHLATHHVTSTTRYFIDKVYRHKTDANAIGIASEHPKELYEMAFDFVFLLTRNQRIGNSCNRYCTMEAQIFSS